MQRGNVLSTPRAVIMPFPLGSPHAFVSRFYSVPCRDPGELEIAKFAEVPGPDCQSRKGFQSEADDWLLEETQSI